MDCPFCCFLRDYIGQYLRIGVVCGCYTNDHIYRDGFIRRSSFFDNTIRLFDAPIGGNVIFTACCDNIFELYIFDNAGAAAPGADVPDIATMVEQRRSLLKSVQGSLQEDESR